MYSLHRKKQSIFDNMLIMKLRKKKNQKKLLKKNMPK